ncbi:MAG: LapA family protein [Candidatus Marinimicrobia bacterium]|nr:LapA family protein [Candidatus Neomarinimicrobiota bacterium]
MRIFKIVVYLVIFSLILAFIVQNMGQPVRIVFFSKARPIQSEMIIVLLITFLIGIFLGLLFTGLRILSLKTKLRALTSENKKLKKELDTFRNKEIDEILKGSDEEKQDAE